MKKLILGTLLLAFSQFASANMITFSNSITSGGVGSIGYNYFNIDAASTVRVETFTNSFDPYLYLFSDDGSLDTGDLIAYDDDSGTASAYGYYNSKIVTGLAAGSYIAAVGDYYFTAAEAVSGIGSPGDLGVGSGPYNLEVEAYTANVSVSEPHTLALMGLSFFLLGLSRKKASQHS